MWSWLGQIINQMRVFLYSEKVGHFQMHEKCTRFWYVYMWLGGCCKRAPAMHRRKAQIRFVSSLWEPALLLLSGVKWSKCMPPPSTASVKNYKHLKKKKRKERKKGGRQSRPAWNLLPWGVGAWKCAPQVTKRLLKNSDSRSECIWQSHKDFPCILPQLQSKFLQVKSSALLILCIKRFIWPLLNFFFFSFFAIPKPCVVYQMSHPASVERERGKKKWGLFHFQIIFF